jgi:hypothetical protein
VSDQTTDELPEEAVLARAGLADPAVTFTTQAAPGLHSAIIRAVKPAG